MRCLQMPLFWFSSFANRIKRIRDKTFCFDVRFRPNPCTRHTSHIHGVGCNSGELCGISISEVPHLLLRKQAMIGSLSQNPFCHLQANSEWLTILESLKKKKEKKKKKQTRALFELTQQTIKGYGLCGAHLGLLPQTYLLHFFLYLFLWGSCLWLTLVSFAVSISTFFYHACMFNSRRICARVVLIVGSTRVVKTCWGVGM